MQPAVSITRLALHHFRNYTQLEFACPSQSVVLVGHNGAGKTNILEALSLLSPGRGLRKADYAELEQLQSPTPWAVAAELVDTTRQITHNIGTGRDPESKQDKRLVKLDGKRLGNQEKLAEILSISWLTPQMDYLLTEGKSDRRRFFDRLVYGFEPAHATHLNAYEKHMRNRNRMLGDGGGDKTWLSATEKNMAEIAVNIAYSRNLTLDRLNDSSMMTTTCFPRAQLAFEGAFEQALREQHSALEVEEMFRARWADERSRDGAAGRTLTGVHRSDLRVHHVEKNQDAALCSTGEQKALLLSMLMAHARARKQWHHASPILLLDEVVAHLDEVRRAALFDELESLGTQAWLTGTDVEMFSGMRGRASFWQVEQASVSKLNA